MVVGYAEIASSFVNERGDPTQCRALAASAFSTCFLRRCSCRYPCSRSMEARVSMFCLPDRPQLPAAPLFAAHAHPSALRGCAMPALPSSGMFAWPLVGWLPFHRAPTSSIQLILAQKPLKFCPWQFAHTTPLPSSIMIPQLRALSVRYRTLSQSVLLPLIPRCDTATCAW